MDLRIWSRALCFIITWIIIITSVLGSFNFLVEPDDKIVSRRNAGVSLSCETNFKSTITWLYNTKAVQKDGFHETLDNGTLVISELNLNATKNKEYIGKYQCMAKFGKHSMLSRVSSLQLAVLSKKFRESPSNVSCEENGVIRFRCQIYSVPEAIFMWEKDKQQLNVTDRHVIHGSGILQISELTLTDVGSYRCIAHNKILGKNMTSNEGFLTLHKKTEEYQPSKFLIVSEHLEAKVGTDVLLECMVTGSPLPQIHWLGPGGSQVVFSENSPFKLLGQGNLWIKSISEEHAGSYTCQAISAGLTLSKRIINVDVVIPPSIECRGGTNHYVSKVAKMSCTVRGYPHPSITWLKDGKDLKINGRFKLRGDAELFIESTIVEDSGFYQCFVENKIGQAYDTIFMNITGAQDQPIPPQELLAEIIPKGIRLYWNVSEESLVAYSIHYMETDGGYETSAVFQTSPGEIVNLKPYTNYTFYLRAYKRDTAGPQSKKFTFMTGEDVPSVPTPFTLKSISSTKLLVTWEILPPSLAHGKIIHHEIQWKSEESSDINKLEVLGNVTKYIIPDLQKGQIYKVRVFSSTKVGYLNGKEEIPWKECQMPENTLGQPKAPQLQVKSLSPKSLNIEWFVIDSSIVIDGFKLSFSKLNETKSGPFYFKSHSNHFLVEDLDPKVWYLVHLIAYNEQGDSDEAIQITRTLELPDEYHSTDFDISLSIKPLSDKTIQLDWLCLANSSYYIVKFIEMKSAETYFIVSSNCSTQIYGLNFYLKYQFQIIIRNEFGRDIISRPIAFTAYQHPPGPPKDFKWHSLNSSSVELSWIPPESTYGITKYYLRRSTNQSLDFSQWAYESLDPETLSVLLSDLNDKFVHYFVLQAENDAGLGKYSEVIKVILPVPAPVSNPVDTTFIENKKDHSILIITTVLGLCAIMTCGIIALCKFYALHYRRSFTSRNTIPHLNGNGCYNLREAHELDVVTPILQQNTHLDTKGGNPDGYIVQVVSPQRSGTLTVHSVNT